MTGSKVRLGRAAQLYQVSKGVPLARAATVTDLAEKQRSRLANLIGGQLTSDDDPAREYVALPPSSSLFALN